MNRHLYGTRGAAAGWEDEYAGTMEELGFTRGLESGCLFYHEVRNLRCTVYGDNFTTVGPKYALDWFEGELEKRYSITR